MVYKNVSRRSALTRESHNCAGIGFIQGDSAGGSKLVEQTLSISIVLSDFNIILSLWIIFNVLNIKSNE